MLDVPRRPVPPALEAMISNGVTFLHIGAIAASTLYLGACIALGYFTHNGPAWKIALLAVAVTYLSHIGQTVYAYAGTMAEHVGYRWLAVLWRINWMFTGGSIMLGGLAGVALLIGS